MNERFEILMSLFAYDKKFIDEYSRKDSSLMHALKMEFANGTQYLIPDTFAIVKSFYFWINYE